ncbi:hypothetical protein NQL31_006289 [Lotmaria passim]
MMFRLHGARFAVVTAAALVARRTATTATCSTALAPLRSPIVVSSKTTAVLSPAVLSSLTGGRRFFSQAPTSHNQGVLLSHTQRRVVPTAASSLGFLRGARLSPCAMSRSGAMSLQLRAFRVKGSQDKASPEQKDAKQQQSEEAGAKDEGENGDEKAKAEGERTAAESAANEGQGKGKKAKAAPKKKSFMDHINDLRDDYAKFPDIYNSANLINFVVFTVFCLCSTGSNTEETWWMTQWGLDNSFRPWTWFLHSFLTNNFLSMTYAMMLLHTMCHHVLPTLGSRGLMLYVGSAAFISGAIMWLGNYLYYGTTAAPEKQFGPWDVVSALFVMEYFYYGLTPLTILNSFSGWIKYAVWVGEICILYFDWQPTVVGTLVGLALCRGVPRFKAMKPAAAAAAGAN